MSGSTSTFRRNEETRTFLGSFHEGENPEDEDGDDGEVLRERLGGCEVLRV